MKRTYKQPTAAVINLGDDLMRTQITGWSVGHVTRQENGSSVWAETVEMHPAQERQDWSGRLNTADGAWGADIWGESE